MELVFLSSKILSELVLFFWFLCQLIWFVWLLAVFPGLDGT